MAGIEDIFAPAGQIDPAQLQQLTDSYRQVQGVVQSTLSGAGSSPTLEEALRGTFRNMAGYGYGPSVDRMVGERQRAQLSAADLDMQVSDAIFRQSEYLAQQGHAGAALFKELSSAYGLDQLEPAMKAQVMSKLQADPEMFDERTGPGMMQRAMAGVPTKAQEQVDTAKAQQDALMPGNIEEERKKSDIILGRENAHSRFEHSLGPTEPATVSVITLMSPDGKQRRAFANTNKAAIGAMLNQGWIEAKDQSDSGFTLGADQVRYDANGNVIARGPGGAPNQRDQKIANYKAMGIDPDSAVKLADDLMVLTQPDQFGNSYLVDKATGNAQRLKVKNPSDVTTSDQGTAPPPSAAAPNLESATKGGTGLYARLGTIFDAVAGGIFTPGTSQAPETAKAKQTIRMFNQTAKTMLVNNPRFPVAEQQLVEKMLPDPDAMFTNPATEAQKVPQLRDYLVRLREGAQQSIQSGNITQQETGLLANKVESINRILDLMGPVSGGRGGGQPTVEHKTIGGKTYMKVNGQWMEETQ